MRWAPNAGILAHLTNGVLLETPLWDELQQKECGSIGEFYRKAKNFLKLENYKGALHKSQEVSTSKKNDQGEASKSNKCKEKRNVEEKRSKSEETTKWAGRKQSALSKVHELQFPQCSSRSYLCGK